MRRPQPDLWTSRPPSAIEGQTTHGGPRWNSSSALSYDFTDGPTKYYLGTVGCRELETGVWGMISGDVDESKIINAIDRVQVYSASGFDYYVEDLDLSGIINATDRVIISTASGFSGVP